MKVSFILRAIVCVGGFFSPFIPIPPCPTPFLCSSRSDIFLSFFFLDSNSTVSFLDVTVTGVRLKEARHINTSLSALGNVTMNTVASGPVQEKLKWLNELNVLKCKKEILELF